MTKKKPKIFNNLGLKIIALVFSILLWIFVTSINDPITSMTVSNVPVRLLHTNLITDQGQVYSVLDDTDVVPVVTVRASRSIIDTLQSENITATADVENITSLNTVEIKFSSTKYNSEITSITGSISSVKLSIENRKTRSFTLTTVTTGDVAAGYQLGTVTPEQNQIRVSGPESVVMSIARAEASVNVTGATGTINTYSDIKLYDAADKEIDTENLTMNITSVKVSVQVIPVNEVPITAQYQGTPANGYLLSGVLTVEPSAVELAGKTSALSMIQSIVIPADQLDISGATGTIEKRIDITPYLPADVSFADSSFDGYVTVTVGIEQAENVSIEADLSQIALTNVPEGYTAVIVSVSDGTTTASSLSGQTRFAFRFSGLAADVESIQSAELTPSVDVGALVPAGQSDLSGTYEGAVSIVVPDNATQTNTVTARIQLTSISQAAGEDNNGEGTEHSSAEENGTSGSGTDASGNDGGTAGEEEHSTEENAADDGNGASDPDASDVDLVTEEAVPASTETAEEAQETP